MRDVLQLPGIKPVNIEVRGRIVAIHATVEALGVRPICPTCSKAMVRHGKREQEYADRPLQKQPAVLVLQVPRFRCEDCRETQNQDIPVLDERRRATRRLVDQIRQQCLSAPFHRLAEDTGLAVNTIKNIAQDLIDDLDLAVKSATPTLMGIAEMSLAQETHLAIFNLATETIVEILHGRGWLPAKTYFSSLPDIDSVEWVCIGSTKHNTDDLLNYFPNAVIVDANTQGSSAGEFQKRIGEKLDTAAAGIQTVSKHLGGWYSFEVLRAKILYARHAREVVRADLQASGSLSGIGEATSTDYGAHIPTLVEMARRSPGD